MALITLKHLKMLIGGKDGEHGSHYNMGVGEALIDEDRQIAYGKDGEGREITDDEGITVGTVTGWLAGAQEYAKVATEVLTGFIGPPQTIIYSPLVEANEHYYNGTPAMTTLRNELNKSFTGTDLKPLLILRLVIDTENKPSLYDDSDPDSPNAETVLGNRPEDDTDMPTLIYYDPPSKTALKNNTRLPTITIVENVLFDEPIDDYLIVSKILKTQQDYEDVFSLSVWGSEKAYNTERRLHLKSLVFNGFLTEESKFTEAGEAEYLRWTGDGANIEDIDTDHTQDTPSMIWLIWTDPTFGYDMTEYSPVANYCLGRIGRLIQLLKHYDPTMSDPCIHCGGQEIARDGRYCIDCGRHPYNDGPPISAKEDYEEQELLRK
jgi:hypothetical protein